MTRDEANEGRDLALLLQAEFDRVTPGYEIQEDDLPFIIKNLRARIQYCNTHVQRTRLCLQYCLCFHTFYDSLEVNVFMLRLKMQRCLYIDSAGHSRRDLSSKTASQS